MALTNVLCMWASPLPSGMENASVCPVTTHGNETACIATDTEIHGVVHLCNVTS
eukprot:m.1606807 g.1606807  ORF g.1606807 m.1606807 type:complete len:54 (+) comp25361_c0_seq20:6238-6399(+)